MVKSQSFSVVSTKGFMRTTPALFTRMSICLNSCRVFLTSFSTSDFLETSHLMGIAWPFCLVISLHTFWQPLRLMSETTTLAPSLASSMAIAAPMPRWAPVTMATLFLSFIVEGFKCFSHSTRHFGVFE